MNSFVKPILSMFERQEEFIKNCKHDIIEFSYDEDDKKYKLLKKGRRCKKCRAILEMPKYENSLKLK